MSSITKVSNINDFKRKIFIHKLNPAQSLFIRKKLN